MTADFLDSHIRHWQDAELLYDNNRHANADHLYGFSAECGLKRLMVCFGMTVEPDGSPTKRTDRIHADEAWDRFESYRSGHVDGAAYVLAVENPFADWEASQRYAPRSAFDPVRVQARRAGAEIVRNLIANAQQQGLI